MRQPFQVLDLTTSLAGAYCGRLRSSGGIEVARVEPPTGGVLDLSGFESIMMTQLFTPHTVMTRAPRERAAQR